MDYIYDLKTVLRNANRWRDLLFAFVDEVYFSEIGKSIPDSLTEDMLRFGEGDFQELLVLTNQLSVWCDLGPSKIPSSEFWGAYDIVERWMLPAEYSTELEEAALEHQEFVARHRRPNIKNILDVMDNVQRLVWRITLVTSELSNGTNQVSGIPKYRLGVRQLVIDSKMVDISPRAKRIADLILETERWHLDFSSAQQLLEGTDNYDKRDVSKWGKWRTEFNNAAAAIGYQMEVSKKDQCFRITKILEENS